MLKVRHTSVRQNTNEEKLSERDFERLADFIHHHCGIHITSRKRTMLEARVRKRMQACNLPDTRAYCHFLLEGHGIDNEEEVVQLIDAITVNKTDFFREAGHFSYLEKYILPEMYAKGKRHFKIWSAASSNGSEPYSIAMTVYGFSHKHPGTDYFVLASDICTEMLRIATMARYTETQIAQIPMANRREHLLISKDRSRREYRVAPHLRTKIAFIHLNLNDILYPVSVDYDVIFCRNVLIYFDKPTQKRILSQLISHLQPEGYLILGHSESIVGMDLPLTSVANTVFRRR